MDKGQIWVETVLYTLIGLVLIGIVLALVTPKINETKDRALVAQSVDSLNAIDVLVNEVVDKGQGNVRKLYSFSMKKGELIINSSSDKIVLVIDELSKPYSEPGAEIRIGNIKLVSQQGQDNAVFLELDYSGFANLTYSGDENLRKFGASSLPYGFTFENKGIVVGISVVEIREVSR